VLLAATAILAVPAAFWGWEATAFPRGQFAAWRDVRHGKYQELTYGLKVQWFPYYAILLQARYRIEVRCLASRLVPNGIVSYAAGYNAVSVPAAKRRFGHDVFRECRDEARGDWARWQESTSGGSN
jgi:hypothetical protein